MQYAVGFLIALSVTIALMPALMRLGLHLHIVDAPGGRRVHTTPIPRVGGIAMAVGMALALALFGSGGREWQALLAGGAVLLAFGILDDRFELGVGAKLAGQILAVLIAIFWGGVKISSVTLADRQMLPEWLSLPLTLVFMVGATNAVNLADGLDGLAGGMTLLCLSALAVIAGSVHQPFVIGSAVVVIGAILGFLRFNTHPARVFMGDAGSQLLGFAAAYLAIVLTQDASTPLSTALPLLLLGVPLVDMAAVSIERIAAGRSPFKADRSHLHHRLLALGFDHAEAVALIYGVQTLFFVTAWFQRYDSDQSVCASFLIGAAILVGSIHGAQRLGWRRHQLDPLRRIFDWVRSYERLSRWSERLIVIALGAYALMVALIGRAPQGDTRWLGVAALGLLVLGIAWRRGRGLPTGLERIALYVSAALAVYLDAPTRLGRPALVLEGVLLVLLVAGLIVRIRAARGQRFELTTLDMLVVVVALAVPNLPGSLGTQQGLGAAVLKLVALFYALETLGSSIPPTSRRPWLSVAGIAFLGMLLLRTF